MYYFVRQVILDITQSDNINNCAEPSLVVLPKSKFALVSIRQLAKTKKVANALQSPRLANLDKA